VSQENRELVLSLAAKYNARELDAVIMHCTEDISVAPDRSVFPEGEPFVGREQYRSLLEETWAAWSSGGVTVEEMLDLDDGRLLVRYEWRAVGSASGIETTTSLSTIWSFRDGKISAAEYFFDHDKALKAVGLSE
jgi:ketosteroid isomerase-like protein